MSEVGTQDYRICNFHPNFLDDYIRLNAEVEEREPSGRCVSARLLAERLGRPNYQPDRDLFIAEAATGVVGFLDVTPELSIGRVVLDCVVHPQHWRKGIATALFRYGMHRAREFGARAAHVNIAENNAAASNLLTRLGFRRVRRSLELELPLSEARYPDAEHATLRCRHFQQGDEGTLTQLQNRSFAGTWGYDMNTVEEIEYRINMSDCCPESIILAVDGDRIVGYCWTTITSEEKAVAGTRGGRIYMLGVDPDYRGRGIGKQVLAAGLSHLQGKGLETVELTVDSQNRAARALYESAGFRVSSTTLWYEKVVGCQPASAR